MSIQPHNPHYSMSLCHFKKGPGTPVLKLNKSGRGMGASSPAQTHFLGPAQATSPKGPSPVAERGGGPHGVQRSESVSDSPSAM